MYAILDANNEVCGFEERNIDLNLLVVPELQHLYIPIKENENILLGDIYDLNKNQLVPIYTKIKVNENNIIEEISYSSIIEDNETVSIRGRQNLLGYSYLNGELKAPIKKTLLEEIECLKQQLQDANNKNNMLEECIIQLAEIVYS